MTTFDILEITDNIDDPKEVISHTGPIRIAQSVEHLRVSGIYATHGFITFDGEDGSMTVAIARMVVNDPRGKDGLPYDGYHLGGLTGHIGTIIGSGLQMDLGKIGRGTHDLTIDHSIGHAVAMEKPQTGGGAPGDKHQDGWQAMAAKKVTIKVLDYFGGPNTNHAALFCTVNDPGKDDPALTGDPTITQDVVALGGTIVTKAAGIALGTCSRCGARNMHITAHFPFEKSDRAVDPIDEGNIKMHYVAA